MWRRRELTYDSADSANSRRDLNHAFSNEPEFFVYRGNTTTLRYSQRPKRCDDEQCKRDVDYIRRRSRNGILYRSRDFSR